MQSRGKGMCLCAVSVTETGGWLPVCLREIPVFGYVPHAQSDFCLVWFAGLSHCAQLRLVALGWS